MGYASFKIIAHTSDTPLGEIETLNRKINAEPGNLTAYNDRGLAYWRIGDNNKALADFGYIMAQCENRHGKLDIRDVVFLGAQLNYASINREMGNVESSNIGYRKAKRTHDGIYKH